MNLSQAGCQWSWAGNSPGSVEPDVGKSGSAAGVPSVTGGSAGATGSSGKCDSREIASVIGEITGSGTAPRSVGTIPGRIRGVSASAGVPSVAGCNSPALEDAQPDSQHFFTTHPRHS